MTPERLAEIKARAEAARQAAADGTYGTTPETVTGLTINEALELIHASAEDVPDLLAEVERLRDGIEALTGAGYEHTPECERERSWAALDRHPDCGRCWEDELTALLNPEDPS